MGEWRKLSSRLVHENPFYNVREDTVIRPDGKEGMYYVTETKRSAFIIPVKLTATFYLLSYSAIPRKRNPGRSRPAP
jgi:hypothetical protein